MAIFPHTACSVFRGACSAMHHPIRTHQNWGSFWESTIKNYFCPHPHFSLSLLIFSRTILFIFVLITSLRKQGIEHQQNVRPCMKVKVGVFIHVFVGTSGWLHLFPTGERKDIFEWFGHFYSTVGERRKYLYLLNPPKKTGLHTVRKQTLSH